MRISFAKVSFTKKYQIFNIEISVERDKLLEARSRTLIYILIFVDIGKSSCCMDTQDHFLCAYSILR